MDLAAAVSSVTIRWREAIPWLPCAAMAKHRPRCPGLSRRRAARRQDEHSRLPGEPRWDDILPKLVLLDEAGLDESWP